MGEFYKIKSLTEFTNESSDSSLWRNTDYRWLLELLNKGKIKSDNNRFISFSIKEDSGGQDDFGGTRIEFNSGEIYKQGAIEIYYDAEFFEKYPEISRYVTGYKTEKDYYKDKGYAGAEEANEDGELTWEDYIGDFEIEDEVVIKEIKFTSDLIKGVKFIKDKPSKQLITLLNKYNISYT